MWRAAAVLLVLALTSVAAISAVVKTNGGGDEIDEGPITISFRYSRFSKEEVTVRAGQPVTFILRNDDPIAHEWMVGNAAMHERHRIGTEPYHDKIPAEVSVPAYDTRETTLTFDMPGEYAFVCHLPGHEKYGMRGVVRVLPG